MTDQTKAPEQILTNAGGQFVVTNLMRHPGDVEYVRADIAAEQVREAYERAAQILDNYAERYFNADDADIEALSAAIRALKSDDTNGDQP